MLGVFFNYKFNFTSSDRSVQIVCFFLILSWQVICFLKLCPFLLGCPICWHIPVHSILIIFCISVVLVVISPLSFLILFGSSLFSWWAWLKVYQFYLFKKPALGFIDLFYCFFDLYFILFPLWSLLFPSFCWLCALFLFF